MSVDDLLFCMIFGGMLLSVAYLRDQYAMRRRYRIAERETELRLRELYGSRANAPDPLKHAPRPDSGAAVPPVFPNPVLNRSLPVHVRFVYRTPVAINQPRVAYDPGICQITQKLKMPLESPITRR